MKHYTKTEKKEYFRKLRENWKSAQKQLTEGRLNEIQAIIKTHGWNISAKSYFWVSLQMQQLGFDGIPYLDCKTFQGWKENGFRVKKGEKSQITGITWICPASKKEEVLDSDDTKSDYVFPKEYHLFHRTQVEAA